MGNTPGWGATTTIFLGYGEGNPLVKSAAPHRHFSGIGASGYRRVPGIERERIRGLRCSDLDAINQAADSPAPRGVLPMVTAIGVTIGGVAKTGAVFGIKLVERIVNVRPRG